MSWAHGLQHGSDRLPGQDLELQWHPTFDDDAPATVDEVVHALGGDPVAAPAGVAEQLELLEPPDATPDRPIEAHGMTGSVGFDGMTVTIRIEDHAADRSADRSIDVPIDEIDDVEWIPATTTHRGVLRIGQPDGQKFGIHPLDPARRLRPTRSEVAFKLRQQQAFELVHDAIQRHLDDRLH